MEIKNLILEWEEFIKFNPDEYIIENKILQISTWQFKFASLLRDEQLKQVKINSKLRKEIFKIQENRLLQKDNIDYTVKTVSEIEIFVNGQETYNNLLVELEESKVYENLYKELLKTARDITQQMQRYIDFKKLSI